MPGAAESSRVRGATRAACAATPASFLSSARNGRGAVAVNGQSRTGSPARPGRRQAGQVRRDGCILTHSPSA